MRQPRRVKGARICVLLQPNETTICANPSGFKALGSWMAWLAKSNPDEHFHLHLLWHLESEESRFDGVRPKNVWVLRSPDDHEVKQDPPDGMQAVDFDVTFQVVGEEELDRLAAAQESGVIPERYRNVEASYTTDCG